MGNGTGSAPPESDGTATPARPPGGGRLMSGLGIAGLGGQQAFEQQHRSALRERLVAVAALGGLNPARAAGRALAACNRLSRCLQPWPGCGKAALGESRAPLMTVIHKDGQSAC